MFSYWEQQSFVHYDHIVVGAGIVGLSVAIELRQKFPQERILIIERGLMSTGASSRNAGFACMGSLTELLADVECMSEEEVVHLFEARKRGLSLLRQRLGDQAIDYQENGSYELLHQQNLHVLSELDRFNALLKPITHKAAFRIANERIANFGFDPNYTQALVENTCEGELDSGKMLRALTDFALAQNIEIKTGAALSHFEEVNNAVLLFIPDTLRQATWQLRCRNIYICTNAFTQQLMPEAALKPGRGQILITKPIEKLPFKGIFHFDDGYYYFRTIHQRVLLGGGRNLDFESETTTHLQLNEMIQDRLDHVLKNIILPNTQFEIEQRWSGIMAFGDSKTPVVKAFSPRVYGAFRMGGMGVALGSYVAQQIASLAE
jgi:gamma-glutamylputrescine oxidase